MSFGSFMQKLHNGKKTNNDNDKLADFNHNDVFFNLGRFLIISQIVILLSIIVTIVGIILFPTVIAIITGAITTIMQLFVIAIYSFLRKFIVIVKCHDKELADLKKNHICPPPPPINE